MSETIVIFLVLCIFVFLFLTGLYIYSVLLVTGIVGLVFLQGIDILPGLLGNQPFQSTATYTLTTIPLFVLMAQFILQSDMINDLFYMINRLSRGKSGFLGVFTIIAGGLLGAVSGSGTATAASLGQVVVPELKSRGFKPELAGAIAASSGALSAVIPPSILMIVYGVATETPIGLLFIGAIIPGLLIVVVFIVVMLVCYRYSKDEDFEENKRNDISKQEKVPLQRLIITFFLGVIIMTVVFGGIYAGFVTPTEAGAIGAFISFLAALTLRKVNIDFMRIALNETVKVTGMVMLIVIGAQVFGRFVSLSLLPRKFIDLLDPIMDLPVLVLTILAIVFFVLFMFMEGVAVILMTASIAVPVIELINVDVLWFGIFISVIATIGLITPPVGMTVYAVSSVAKIPSNSIFKYGLIFAIVSMVVVCSLMIVFPEIVLWLPNSIK